jgi:LysM repeat protein
VKTASLYRNSVVFLVLVLMLVLAMPAKEASAAPAASGCHNTYYTIRCGDTLSSIARRFGVSMWELARVNGIHNPNRIYAGTTIVIPTGCCTSCCTGCNQGGGHVYIVRWGDTLSGIAWRYGTTAWRIAQANGIHNINCIYAGQRLIIP